MARLINADYLLCALGLDDMTEANGYKMDLMRSDIRAAIQGTAKRGTSGTRKAAP